MKTISGSLVRGILELRCFDRIAFRADPWDWRFPFGVSVGPVSGSLTLWFLCFSVVFRGMFAQTVYRRTIRRGSEVRR